MNWQTQLQDNIRRDLIDKFHARKTSQAPAFPRHHHFLYGDNNNWFAAYALWQLKYYGPQMFASSTEPQKVLGREPQLSTEATKGHVQPLSRLWHCESWRAHKEEVFAILEWTQPGQLVDVRSVD